jgi:hypothetical protein
MSTGRPVAAALPDAVPIRAQPVSKLLERQQEPGGMEA